MNDLPPKKVTLEEAQAILRHIRKPMGSYKSAGNLFNLAPDTIPAVLDAHGLVIRSGKKGQSALSDAEIKYALKRLGEGATRDSVRRELEVHINTLKRAFKLNGIQIPVIQKKQLSQAEVAHIIKLFKNGLSTRQVTIKTGIPVSDISYYYLPSPSGRPTVNFNPTPFMFVQLQRLLEADNDIKYIADAFETTEYFVRLMIISLGIPGFFKQKFKYPPQHGLTAKMISRFIVLKFKGVSSGTIASELNTTRPTLNKILVLIENYFYENIMGGQYEKNT